MCHTRRVDGRIPYPKTGEEIHPLDESGGDFGAHSLTPKGDPITAAGLDSLLET